MVGWLSGWKVEWLEGGMVGRLNSGRVMCEHGAWGMEHGAWSMGHITM